MSRGKGRVQRAIEATFAAEPDNALLLSELCERVYPGVNRVEKKHRIAVARAAKLIPGIRSMERELLGHELVFYDPSSVMSCAMARLKADNFGPGACYRNNDYRPNSFREYEITEDDLRALLALGERAHKLISEGGAWWRHTEQHKAAARGDVAEVERFEAIGEQGLASIMGGLADGILRRRP